jgi:hypothetical protein
MSRAASARSGSRTSDGYDDAMRYDSSNVAYVVANEVGRGRDGDVASIGYCAMAVVASRTSGARGGASARTTPTHDDGGGGGESHCANGVELE